jgi:hypothetical protein
VPAHAIAPGAKLGDRRRSLAAGAEQRLLAQNRLWASPHEAFSSQAKW